MSAKKWNTLRLTMKTIRGMRLLIRLGTTKVPRTLHPVSSTMNAPITAPKTRMAMPQLCMAMPKGKVEIPDDWVTEAPFGPTLEWPGEVWWPNATMRS
jgi:hypothetical protein